MLRRSVLSPRRTIVATVVVLLIVAVGLASAKAQSKPSKTSTVPATVKILIPGIVQANYGGYIAAATSQAAKKDHLKIEIINAGASDYDTLPQVASGEYQFTLSMTSNVLVARGQNLPITQIFAPHGFTSCLMAHAGSGVTSFASLSGKTIAIAPGNAWFPVVEAKYHLTNITTVAYSGTVAPFLANQSLVQQCYLTNEPYQARAAGANIVVLPIANSGFDPYADALVTTQPEINKHPKVVQELVDAVKQGWKSFDARPSAYYAKLKALGNTATNTENNEAVQALKTVNNPTGSASAAKVKSVAQLLVQTKQISASVGNKYAAAFDNKFVDSQ